MGAVRLSAAVPLSHSLSSPDTARVPVTADRFELFFFSTPAFCVTFTSAVSAVRESKLGWCQSVRRWTGHDVQM